MAVCVQIRFWLVIALVLGPFVKASGIFDELLAALEAARDCPSCLNLLVPLQTLAILGDDAFISNFTTICDDLHLEDADVCAGIVAEEGPIIAHDLRQINTTGQTAVKLCDGLIGLCQPPAVNPYTVPFPKPAPKNPKKFQSHGRTPFQVVHFSDVHIDREYTAGSNANCTKPICCRNFADDTAPPTEPAGPNGNSNCDAPTSLADSMYKAIEDFGSSAEFSIFTGDVVEHSIWLVNKSGVTTDLKELNTELLSNLKRPVFPSLGNHDTAPVNSFPRSTTISANTSQWVFDTQSAGWEHWIGSVAAGEVDHVSGNYAVAVPGHNLKIISLNTQFWYKSNFWLYDTDIQQPDPNGVLAFMVRELQAAEDAGQRVWLIGHIPLGTEDVMNDQSNYFDQIVQRYKNTIAGQFFGHTHNDQFEIAYSDYTNQIAANAVSIALIAPSLTPTSGNPAFKIYDIDPDTFEVMDARVYISNISNPTFQITPTWELYYSAREAYGPLVTGGSPLPITQSLSPAFWHNLTEVFETDDTAFQLYNTHISRGGKVTACDDTCKTTTICDLRALRAENNCDNPTPGLAVRRRGIERFVRASECEGINIGHLFLRIASALST